MKYYLDFNFFYDDRSTKLFIAICHSPGVYTYVGMFVKCVSGPHEHRMLIIIIVNGKCFFGIFDKI